MFKIANKPITVPAGVEVIQEGSLLLVKGKKGNLRMHLNENVVIKKENNLIHFSLPENIKKEPMLGTTRVLLQNLIKGVHEGYEVKLLLVGVGYRAKAEANRLELALGRSHADHYSAPEGVTVETPSHTEIIVKGIDKQLVNQVAANIRLLRSPDAYKAKGIRYSNEKIKTKQLKKSTK